MSFNYFVVSIAKQRKAAVSLTLRITKSYVDETHVWPNRVTLLRKFKSFLFRDLRIGVKKKIKEQVKYESLSFLPILFS